MSTFRALLRLSLIATSLAAVPNLAARAQDAEPDAAPAAEAPAKPKPKPRPKPAPHKAVKPTEAAKPEETATPAAAAAHAVWPAGASTVSESYGDWTMTCTRPSDKVTCIVAQSQGDSRTGRRKFGFELQTPANGRAEGIVLMPFGLAIEPGVTFKLDEQTLGKGAPYTTCSAEGCIVAISFPTLALDGMRTAKALTVTGEKAGGTEPATVTVPLTGFSQAFDRAVALGG
ncbi:MULTISPECIES: invasion associated locus B family protein [unclassified Methylobacterium]|uniref:invasion associated locus B family protein n=1 Tax=unclassified Methylobacterium TaxID=2615210 RepID=UPI00089F628E|nr:MULTISPECIES: invasion associated locus B family protein [unclassified Methylobacterium]SEF46969.1 Invasion protein IalB, involved in pathogenesis [Methylobacterium sp. 190mf]SFS79307.1 Invasion protein IalB, involved in pathogenesis [Methylobacterium sp. yr668]